jgi:hypothetical protein
MNYLTRSRASVPDTLANIQDVVADVHRELDKGAEPSPSINSNNRLVSM